MLKNSENQGLVTDHRQKVGVENGLHSFSRLPCVEKDDLTDNKVVQGVDLWNIQLIGMLHQCKKTELLKHSTNLSGLDSAEVFQALHSVAVNFGTVLGDIHQLQNICC